MARETRPKDYPKLKNYQPTRFMLPTSHYDKAKADRAVTFIENLCHTKGKWAGKRFWLLPWQEQLIRDIFGIVKPDGNRQFRTAFVEICKKVGKSELAAAIALYLFYADNEPSAEVYGAAADRQQASIVFDVARQMVEMSPALMKRSKLMSATKRIVNYGKTGIRRDSKHRVLRRGESIRWDGKYQFKYHVNGKAHFVYSWRLEPTDKLPAGKKPCLSLRELEKQIGYDLDSQMHLEGRSMTVEELVERYLSTRIGVKPNTKANYNFVKNLMKKEDFYYKKIGDVKTSDAKLFLIKLQQDGKRYSTVKTVRGVLRPAFQMAVDDDVLHKNPFGFELAGVVVNDSVTREALTRDQMRKFLKFVHDDNVYCKYYEVVYILFHTGMRISEFCGLTIKDIDLGNRIVNIDHQLQRLSDMTLVIEPTKTSAGTRKLPVTEDVAKCFQAIIEDREKPKVEKVVDGYTGFLFLDDKGLPLVAMHWEHRFNHMVKRYNDIYRV